MSKLSCRNCGHDLIEFNEAAKAVQTKCRYTTEELASRSAPPHIHVWCPDCAVSDGRIDDISEVSGEFHWEIR